MTDRLTPEQYADAVEQARRKLQQLADDPWDDLTEEDERDTGGQRVSGGWTRVHSNLPGLYANGGFRIQRLSRGWRWWHVVQLSPDYPHGKTRTLREAKAAADAAVSGLSQGQAE